MIMRPSVFYLVPDGNLLIIKRLRVFYVQPNSHFFSLMKHFKAKCQRNLKMTFKFQTVKPFLFYLSKPAKEYFA